MQVFAIESTKHECSLCSRRVAFPLIFNDVELLEAVRTAEALIGKFFRNA